MALKVTLGTNSILGLTGLTYGALSSPANDNAVLARNTVYVVTGSDNLSVQLPLPIVGQNWGGSAIIFKNNGTGTLTVGRESTVKIDGGEDDQTVAADASQIYYYVDETNGWISIL